MLKCTVFLVGTGLLILVASALLGWIFIPEMIQGKIKQQVKLQNGTETWRKWEDVRVPVYMSFYIYNTTNPSEVEKGGLPEFTEHGPYVYEEKRSKIDLSINEEADTVTYRQPITYYFRPDMSNGTEDDIINIINVPLLGLATKAANLNYFVQILLNQYVLRFKKVETLFLQRKVRQILFEGYTVEVMDELQKMSGMKLLPNSTFGFYYGKNGTDGGLYEIYSGISDSTRFGTIRTWNTVSELSWWGRGGGGEACNMINGSDGTIFPPFVTRDRVLRLFNPDLCRSLHLTFEGETEYKGVSGLRFRPPPDMLQDPAHNSANLCFCPKPEEGCLKTGAMPLSVCRKGAPIVASTPHFLDGDPLYLEQAGLVPDRSKHETYIELEPNTGLVLQAAKRIQVNVDLKPSSVIDPFKKVPTMIFPVFWAEEYGALSDETVAALKRKLLTPLAVIGVGKWVGILVSCILVAAGLGFGLRTKRKSARI